MDVYKTEEEQVQAIQQWWKDNSKALIAGVIIAAAVLGGYRYWTDYKLTRAQKASVIYSHVLSSSGSNKEKDAELLKADYSATPYAALAGLLLAKDELGKKETDKAIAQLKWVIDNGNDDGIKHIAKQRLARVYLSQNNIESAETLLKGVKTQAFDAAYSEIRGDINLAKNLPVQAKENYRLALSAMTQGDQRYSIIKMKLDDLAQAVAQDATNGVKSK